MVPIPELSPAPVASIPATSADAQIIVSSESSSEDGEEGGLKATNGAEKTRYV